MPLSLACAGFGIMNKTQRSFYTLQSNQFALQTFVLCICITHELLFCTLLSTFPIHECVCVVIRSSKKRKIFKSNSSLLYDARGG